MATWTPAQLSWFKAVNANNANAAEAAAARLGPSANANYQNARSDANFNYGTALATNEFNRGQAAQMGTVQRQGLMQRYQQMRDQMPYQYNNRGLLGSGIEHQGLQQAAQNQSTQMGQFDLNQQQRLGQFDIMRQNLAAQRTHTLANLNASRAAAVQQSQLGTVNG